MKLILVRHGETHLNKTGRIQGIDDAPLNATGREQARAAAEALTAGLVSRIVPKEHYYEEALRICRELCDRPPLALRLAKDSVLKAQEMSLSQGLEYERKLFYLLFATDDQREGMQAFVEKRPPVFAGR